MDVLGVNQTGNIGKKPQKKSKKSADIKVVYISSPMKVKTSASEFRALVQKLTGQDSDAERFIELINGAAAAATAAANPLDHHQTSVLHHPVLYDDHDASYRPTPDPLDDVLLHSFDGSFTGMFQNVFHESALL